MASAVAPLHLVPPEKPSPLDRVRDRVSRFATQDGNTNVQLSGLCVYRFSQPTTFRKAAAYGVTLGVALQGSKRVRLGDHELAVDPSRLLVITRETEHHSAATISLSGKPYLGMSLCFCPERVAHAMLALADAGAPSSREAEAVPAFVMPCDDDIADALDRLVRTLDDPLDRKLIAPLVIDELLFRLLRSDAAAAVRSGLPRAADAGRILESMQFIRDNHARKMTVNELARKVAMSASHFAHRFSAVARTSPMRYLREVRLERARTLLLEGGARAGEVAMTVGFESPAHFAREFKRRYGVPPSQMLRGA